MTIRLRNSMLTDDYFAPLIASCRKANLGFFRSKDSRVHADAEAFLVLSSAYRNNAFGVKEKNPKIPLNIILRLETSV